MKKVVFRTLSDKLRDLNRLADFFGEKFVVVIDMQYLYLYSNINDVVYKSLVPEQLYLQLCAMVRRYHRRLSSEFKRNREHC